MSLEDKQSRTDCLNEQMWKVHRFVCGARSNPFTFPGLTDIETERVKALWDLKDFRDMWIERLNRTAIERGKMFGSSEHMRVAYNVSFSMRSSPYTPLTLTYLAIDFMNSTLWINLEIRELAIRSL